MSCVFDSGAKITTLNFLDALEGEMKPTTHRIRGITGDSQQFDGEGEHKLLGKVLILQNAPISVASMTQLAKDYHIGFDDRKNMFRLWDKNTKLLNMVALNENNLYHMYQVIDPYLDTEGTWKGQVKPGLSEKDAKNKCLELHRTLNHYKNIPWFVENKHFTDFLTGFTPFDHINCSVCLAQKDYRGKGAINGKSYRKKRARYTKNGNEKHEYVVKNLDKAYNVTVAFDIVFMSGWMTLVAVTHPMIYVDSMEIKNKTQTELLDAMEIMINKISSYAGVNKVTRIYTDGERAIDHLTSASAYLQRRMEQSVAKKHNSMVEPYIRQLRNGHRANLGEYPFNPTMMTSKLAWQHSVDVFNYLPNKFCGHFLPIQVMHKQEKYKTPVRFGRIVYVENPDTAIGPEYPRHIPAVIVGFQHHSKATKVLIPKSSRVLLRGELKPIPEEDGPKLFLECGNPTSLADQSDPWLDMDEEEDNILIVHHTGQFEPLVSSQEVEREESGTEYLVNFMEMANHLEGIAEQTSLASIEHDAIEFLAGLTQDEEVRKLNLTNPEIFEVVFVGLTLEDKEFEKELKEKSTLHGEEGKKAAGKLELFKLLKKYPTMEAQKVPYSKRHLSVPASLIYTDKVDSNGKKTELKARFIALGNKRQDVIEMLEKFSPTTNFATIILVLNIILIEKMDYMTVDVSSAYIQSSIERETYVRVNKKVAQLIVEVQPETKRFLNQDGTMDLKLLRALYGLEEAGRLWNKFLTKALLDLGFQIHPMDICFFYKDDVINGKKHRMILITYVDDFLVGGHKTQLMEFSKKFGEKCDIKSSEISPEVFEFLKIKIRHDKKDGSFKLSQPGYIESLVNKNGITGKSDMPHSKNKLLDKSDSEPYEDPTGYRSAVMGAMYAARVRPEIKATLCYLTPKCQSPTKRDMENARMLLEYLNATKDFELRLKPTDTRVYGSADASWGTHVDGKSTSGYTATFGGKDNAPTVSKSKKQTGVTANSTAVSELKAVAAAVEEALWLREMLKPLGYDMSQPTVVENDNKSCISLHTKGPSSSGRTKWVNIKTFWVRDHLEKGDIKLAYTPSLQLLADGLTKPLDKALFEIFRARILNFSEARLST